MQEVMTIMRGGEEGRSI